MHSSLMQGDMLYSHVAKMKSSGDGAEMLRGMAMDLLTFLVRWAPRVSCVLFLTLATEPLCSLMPVSEVY